jgi:sugar phosphate isomerase/epimerase
MKNTDDSPHRPPGHNADPDRREFLGVLGALIASTALPPPHGLAPSPAWKKLGPIGLQLYTVRDEMKKNFGRTLARVARTGYKEVEFAGYFGQSPPDVRSILRQNGLTSPAAHIGFPVLGAEWDKTIADALVIGHHYLICPWIDEKLRTADGYKQCVELFNQAGEKAKQAGLQFGYHNHDFEFKPLDGGQLPYDLLITQTDPDKVVMEMDIHWVRFGGADPLDYFRRFPGRFPLLHVKDLDASKKMMDVGKGVIDWKTILGQRQLAGTKHIFVEHDNPPDPFASIRDSYRYLHALEV